MPTCVFVFWYSKISSHFFFSWFVPEVYSTCLPRPMAFISTIPPLVPAVDPFSTWISGVPPSWTWTSFYATECISYEQIMPYGKSFRWILPCALPRMLRNWFIQEFILDDFYFHFTNLMTPFLDLLLCLVLWISSDEMKCNCLYLYYSFVCSSE